ncbi:hypothetical protein [uncultured Jatrophihabitans sp.]|uniref:hypothetical protein n=1 Tax=uncultured Jatrophihabitans sp. TaxID=1610747 RepID=UPI0035CBC598
MSAPRTITCGQCGGTAFAPGYLGSSGPDDRGTYERWYEGELELGMMGGVKHASSRARFQVVAQCCQQCGHLELFRDAQD